MSDNKDGNAASFTGLQSPQLGPVSSPLAETKIQEGVPTVSEVCMESVDFVPQMDEASQTSEDLPEQPTLNVFQCSSPLNVSCVNSSKPAELTPELQGQASELEINSFIVESAVGHVVAVNTAAVDLSSGDLIADIKHDVQMSDSGQRCISLLDTIEGSTVQSSEVSRS